MLHRDLNERSARVGQLLRDRHWQCATAESCTGGLVGHCLTNIAGSSDYFPGGIVAYSNEIKQHLLGVPLNVLQAYGAVSAETALAMAQGVRRALRTEVGVSVTGIAGPGGGTPEKPVGTVYIAVSSPLGDQVRHYVWEGDREGNKWLSADAALSLVLEVLAASGS